MPKHDLTDAVSYHYGKFPPGNLDFSRLIDPVFEAGASLAKYDQMLASLHNSEILLAPLRNQEAVVSSRMEGTISTLDEVLKIEADEAAGNIDVFQQARSEAVETYLYARSLRMLQHSMEGGADLSEHLIREAHQLLLSYGRGTRLTPGSYKSEQNYIGERRKRSVSFVPISPSYLGSGMASLVEFMQNSELNPLLRTAIAHVEFEALHPFQDGNGRIGRMLITLMLWKYGLISQPHFYVSAYFEEMRDEYIEKMRNVSAEDDWTDWCVFFMSGIKEQACRNVDVASRIITLYEDMKVRFREVLNSQWSIDALDFMFTNPTFRNNKFTGMPAIPDHVARSMTRKLRDAGLIEQISGSSGRRPAMYAFTPLIDIVRGDG